MAAFSFFSTPDISSLMTDRSARNRQLAEVTMLGVMFPLSIGAGYLAGRWMDGWLGTGPWLTGIFTGLGVAAAFVNLFRVSMKDDGASPESRGSGNERDSGR